MRRLHTVILFSFFLITLHFVTPAYALDTTISGMVTGEGTSPLDKASIKVIDPQSKNVVTSVQTDAKGEYQFVVPQGTYTIEIQGDNLSKTLQNQQLTANTIKNFALGTPPKMNVSPVPTQTAGKGLNFFTVSVLVELALVFCVGGFLFWKKKKH